MGNGRSAGEHCPAASGGGPTGGAYKHTAGCPPTAHGWQSKQGTQSWEEPSESTDWAKWLQLLSSSHPPPLTPPATLEESE